MSGTERKTNKDILQKNETKHFVRSLNKNANFGHVMRAHQSLEKDITLGITAVARKKGRPRMRWMDDIKLNFCKVNDLK